MTVRRLAEESLQPPVFAFSNDNERWADRKIAQYPAGRQQSAVILLLWRAQEQEGWVSRPAIEYVAKKLHMPFIRVLEVATFYTQFLLQPMGTRAHVLVCGTTPCMLRGAEALREVCRNRIHPDAMTTNREGTLSWEEVECLGACVNAPMVMIGNDTYEDLTPARLETIIEAFAGGHGESVQPGPQIERQYSAAETGPTTLLEPPSAQRERFVPPPATEPAPGKTTPSTPPAPAAEQEPTNKGKKREVSEESAPRHQRAGAGGQGVRGPGRTGAQACGRFRRG